MQSQAVIRRRQPIPGCGWAVAQPPIYTIFCSLRFPTTPPRPGPNWDEAGENGLCRLKTQRLGTGLRRHNVELYIAALQHCSWIPGFEFGTRSTWRRDWQRLAETLAKPEWRTSPKCCIKFSANEGRTSTPACNPYALALRPARQGQSPANAGYR